MTEREFEGIDSAEGPVDLDAFGLVGAHDRLLSGCKDEGVASTLEPHLAARVAVMDEAVDVLASPVPDPRRHLQRIQNPRWRASQTSRITRSRSSGPAGTSWVRAVPILSGISDSPPHPGRFKATLEDRLNGRRSCPKTQPRTNGQARLRRSRSPSALGLEAAKGS